MPADLRAAHFELVESLFRQSDLERIWVSSGVRITFPLSELDRLELFVVNERRCCPFLDLRISTTPAGDSLWLSIEGPPGAGEIIGGYFSSTKEE